MQVKKIKSLSELFIYKFFDIACLILKKPVFTFIKSDPTKEKKFFFWLKSFIHT